MNKVKGSLTRLVWAITIASLVTSFATGDKETFIQILAIVGVYLFVDESIS